MKRKAILIEASNVRGQDEIPGAEVDIENWANFLTSDLGGAWDDSDIVPLHKPAAARLIIELGVPKNSYCFVAFSGHGHNGSVLLNDSYDPFPIALLTPDSDRATVIVDACRGVEKINAYIINTKAAMLNASLNEAVLTKALGGRTTVFARDASLSYARIMSTIEHRARWDQALLLTQKGKVEMLACAQGQDSQEDPQAGGYYTSLLLQSAKIWNINTAGAGIHSTRHAHDYAASNLPPQQTPEYSPSWLAFPFAVKT